MILLQAVGWSPAVGGGIRGNPVHSFDHQGEFCFSIDGQGKTCSELI